MRKLKIKNNIIKKVGGTLLLVLLIILAGCTSSKKTTVSSTGLLDELSIPTETNSAITLPSTISDYELDWNSSVEGVISHRNKIWPSHAADMSLTLTASYNDGKIDYSKDFTILFKKSESADTDLVEFDNFCNDLFIDTLKGDPYTINFTLLYPNVYGLESETLDSEKGTLTLDKILEKLDNFDYSKLSYKQQITYDILLYSTEESYLTLEYSDIKTSLGSYLGYNAYITSSLAEYHFYDTHDITNYFAYIKNLKSDFKDIIDAENAKLEYNTSLPNYILNGVIDQCTSILTATSDNCLIDTFNDKIDSVTFLSSEEKETYKKTNKDLVEKDYMDAFKYLKEEVTKLLDKGTNELGLYYYTDGAKYYEALFQQSCGTTMSVDSLITYLDTKIKEYYTLLTNSSNQIKRSTTNLYYYNNLDLLGNYSYEALLSHFSDLIKDDFPSVGNLKYKVSDVADALKDNSSPAYYFPSVIDADVTESIYVNPNDFTPSSSTDYETKNYIYTTLAHEGIPGHMYQNAYFKQSSYENNALATQNFTCYSEGWATYAEHFILQYEVSNQAVLDYMVSNDVYTYLVYCRCDVGINYQGWNARQLASYFSNKGFTVSTDAATEILQQLREIPTNYLTYYFGYLQIEDLLDYASNALGSKFTYKAFHQAILEFGPAPWSVVKDNVYNYVNKALGTSI